MKYEYILNTGDKNLTSLNHFSITNKFFENYQVKLNVKDPRNNRI